jgi:hypothetical protein
MLVVIPKSKTREKERPEIEDKEDNEKEDKRRRRKSYNKLYEGRRAKQTVSSYPEK